MRTPEPTRAPPTEPPLAATRPSVRGDRRAAALLLAVALLAAGVTRGAVVAFKGVVTTDEGIAYLAATGHQAEYAEIVGEGRAPYGVWAPAKSWKRLVRPGEPGAFGKIGPDLARWDIHPPLYFWLLGLWLAPVGEVTVRWGPALNLLFALATVGGIFLVGRRLFRRQSTAALAGLVWALSPAAVISAREARPYDLFGLLTVLLLLALLGAVGWRRMGVGGRDRSDGSRATPVAAVSAAEAGGAPRGPSAVESGPSVAIASGVAPGRFHRPWALAAVALCTAGMLLTHYHALFVISGAALVLLLPGWRSLPAARLRVAAAILSGSLAAIALHPGFAASVSRGGEQSQPFALAELLPRAERVLGAYAGLVVDVRPPLRWPLATAAAVSLLVVYLVAALRLRRRDRGGRPEQDGLSLPARPAATFGLPGSIFALLAWLAVTNIGLYLLCVSPRHSMGGKYLAPIVPLVALALAAPLERPWRRGGRIAAAALIAGLGLAAALTVAGHRERERHLRPVLGPALAAADAVLVDTTRRIILPAASPYLPDDLPVFAAEKEDLLADPEAWLGGLGERALWISYGESRREAELFGELGQRLAERYEISRLPARVSVRAALLWLERRAPEVRQGPERLSPVDRERLATVVNSIDLGAGLAAVRLRLPQPFLEKRGVTKQPPHEQVGTVLTIYVVRNDPRFVNQLEDLWVDLQFNRRGELDAVVSHGVEEIASRFRPGIDR